MAFMEQVLCNGKQGKVTDGSSCWNVTGTRCLFRQEDLDQQAIGDRVSGADGSAMRSNDAIGNGEAETGSAGLAIAGDGDAIEGAEDIAEFGVRQAWAMIADLNACEGLLRS